MDDSDTARQFRKPFLQLLPIIVGRCFLDLRFDLLAARLDVLFLADAIDNRGVVLVNINAFGTAQHVEGNILEFNTKILRDNLTTSENGDIGQHGLSSVAKARGLDSRNLKASPQAVYDEGGKRFTFDILSNDQQWLTGLNNRL